MQTHWLRAMVIAAMLGGGSRAALAAPVYWNLFNIEGESAADSIYVTYAALSDMLVDTNRTGQFVPNTVGGSAGNVVGSGASIVGGLAPTPVPEPKSLGLVLLGLVCLAGAQARRRTI